MATEVGTLGQGDGGETGNCLCLLVTLLCLLFFLSGERSLLGPFPGMLS